MVQAINSQNIAVQKPANKPESPQIKSLLFIFYNPFFYKLKVYIYINQECKYFLMK